MNICGADLTVRWNDRFRGSQRGVKRGEPRSLESLCARANELITRSAVLTLTRGCAAELAAELR